MRIASIQGLLAVTVTIAVAGASRVSADLLEITGMPVSSEGGFLRSVFHDAASMGGAQGSVQAWFALDRSFVSSIPCTSPLAGKAFWDTGTGALEVGVKLYDTQANAAADTGAGLIGYAKGIGSGLLPSNFTGSAPGAVPGVGGSGALAGSIKWTVISASGGLLNYLNGKYTDIDPGAGNRFVFRTSFLDKYYMGANESVTTPPNSSSPRQLTLWGADGTPDPELISQLGNGGFINSKTGVDLNFTFDPLVAVPEASTLSAAAAAFVLLGLQLRRRSMNSSTVSAESK